MHITPDTMIVFQSGWIKINLTMVYTWAVMGILVFISWVATLQLSMDGYHSRWQTFLESIIDFMRQQIQQVVPGHSSRYLAFLGSMFLFISLSNFLSFVPGYYAPTGSLSTTAALAVCVFFAVPIYGIWQIGIKRYFTRYMQPTVIMLPFHILGELSRTLALAVRLFGNVMSGTLIAAVILTITPLFVPILMQLFSLLIGQIHAYIFTILAMVYIASATHVVEENPSTPPTGSLRVARSPKAASGQRESNHKTEGG